MIKAIKVRLLPTPEQEQQLWKSAGTSRWAYNWALDRQIKHFENTGKLSKTPDTVLRKELTQLKQSGELEWLYEMSNNVTKQAIKDACKAIDRFHVESKKQGYKYRLSAIKNCRVLTFKDFNNFPRFKSKKKSKPSFYNDVVKLKVKDDSVSLEKIGWVKLSEPNRIPIGVKYTNPRISHDNKYWYISVGVDCVQQPGDIVNTGESLGVDVGVKNTVILSNGKKYKNINKSKAIKKIKKKLKRKQRQLSKKYELSKTEIKEKVGENRYRFTKTKNIIKFEKEVKLIHRKLKNIRLNYIHQITAEIVKTKPSRVVVEDLNIKGMMKNKHLSLAIAEQCLSMLIAILGYKCCWNGIDFVNADRWYPSSKKCSSCGAIKRDLKLSYRVFVCNDCSLTIDRDINASINLSNYQLAS